MTGFALALLGVLATLSSQLPLVVLGISLVTTGFFNGHSVTSSSLWAAAGWEAAAGFAAVFALLGIALSA